MAGKGEAGDVLVTMQKGIAAEEFAFFWQGLCPCY
jgi:hypothetical protein